METLDQQIVTDVSREGFTWEKALQPLRLFRPKYNHAIAKVSEFKNIDIQEINRLIGTNIRGVILDVDECIAPHHGEILQENIDAIIKMVQQGIKVVILSNMEASPRYQPLIDKVLTTTGYRIKIITSLYAKPAPLSFTEAACDLNVSEGEGIAMIGDNFVTDGGSIRAGIPFIKVDPIKTKESALKKVKRIFQTGSRGFYSGLSNTYDFLGRRKVVRR